MALVGNSLYLNNLQKKKKQEALNSLYANMPVAQAYIANGGVVGAKTQEEKEKNKEALNKTYNANTSGALVQPTENSIVTYAPTTPITNNVGANVGVTQPTIQVERPSLNPSITKIDEELYPNEVILPQKVEPKTEPQVEYGKGDVEVKAPSYTPSDLYLQAKDYISQQLSGYKQQYGGQINSILNQINDGKTEYTNQMNQYLQQLANYQSQYGDKINGLASAIDSGKTQYTDKANALLNQLGNYQSQYGDKINGLLSAIDSGKTEYTDAVNNYLSQLNNYQSQYGDKINGLMSSLDDGRTQYSDKVDAMLDELGNRKFDYDANSDAMFQNYLAQMKNMGAKAMKDTMGQAAALTGGYGSSYATAAANGAYNDYLDKANAAIPEFYDMALSQFNAEGNAKQNMINNYMNMDENSYKRQLQQLQNYLGLDQKDYERILQNLENNANLDATERQKLLQNLQNYMNLDQTDFNRLQQSFQNYASMDQTEFNKLVQSLQNYMALDQTDFNRLQQNFQNASSADQNAFNKYIQSLNSFLNAEGENFNQWAGTFDRNFDVYANGLNEKYKYDALNLDQANADRNYYASIGLAADGKTPLPSSTTEKSNFNANQLKNINDGALAAYEDGGDTGLDKYLESYGTNLNDSEYADIINYAKNYGKDSFTYTGKFGNIFTKKDNKFVDQNGNTLTLAEIKEKYNLTDDEVKALTKLKKDESYKLK